MNHFIDVILPISLEKRFTYSITQAESEFLKVGMRVSIPFGKSKIYTGIVAKIHQNAPVIYEAKEIHQILDETPIATISQLQLWQWIAKYYMCTEGEVMRAALPNALLLESETIISKNQNQQINDTDLKDDEFLIYEALQHQSSLKIQDISNILDKKNILPVVKRLVDKEAIILNEEVYDKYKPKYVRYVKLTSDYTSETSLNKLLEELSNRAKKQHDVILTLFSILAKTKKPVKLSDLVSESQT
ncbi:MAG: primosomal protein N', partial [Olleya sp.]